MNKMKTMIMAVAAFALVTGTVRADLNDDVARAALVMELATKELKLATLAVQAKEPGALKAMKHAIADSEAGIRMIRSLASRGHASGFFSQSQVDQLNASADSDQASLDECKATYGIK